MIVYEQVTRIGNTELTRRLEVDGQSKGKAKELAEAFFADDLPFGEELEADLDLQVEYEGIEGGVDLGEEESS